MGGGGSKIHFLPVILLQTHLPSFSQAPGTKTTCDVNSILAQKGLFNQFLLQLKKEEERILKKKRKKKLKICHPDNTSEFPSLLHSVLELHTHWFETQTCHSMPHYS